MSKAILVTLLVFGAGAVHAEQTDEQPVASFSKLDVDRDGRISSDEAAAEPRIAERFGTADRDQDGYLSFAEFGAIARTE